MQFQQMNSRFLHITSEEQDIFFRSYYAKREVDLQKPPTYKKKVTEAAATPRQPRAKAEKKITISSADMTKLKELGLL